MLFDHLLQEGTISESLWSACVKYRTLRRAWSTSARMSTALAAETLQPVLLTESFIHLDLEPRAFTYHMGKRVLAVATISKCKVTLDVMQSLRA